MVLQLETTSFEIPDTRIVVPLTVEEREGLVRLAADQCRGAREQLRYMLRQELTNVGIIESEEKKEGISATDSLAAHSTDSVV